MRSAPFGLIPAIMLLFAVTAFADMPGNIRRSDVTVQFINVQSLGKYVLTVLDYDQATAVYSDTTYTIYSSAGVPHMIAVYATDGKTTTDTLYYDEYSQQNYTVTFSGISNQHLQYNSVETPVAAANYQSDEPAAAADITSQAFWKRNEVLIGVSFAALCALIVFFIWRRKKKDISNIDASV